MKVMLNLIFLLSICFPAFSQKNLPSKNYEGNFRIVYINDTLAFANATTGKPIQTKNLYDSTLLINITDSLLTFERDHNYIEYKYFKKRKNLSISKRIYMNPLLSGAPPLHWQKNYKIKFIPITNDAFAIHFKNIKKMDPNYITNANAVKQLNAKPEYYKEYEGELYIILTRTK